MAADRAPLVGNPPDALLAGALALGLEPGLAGVFEDALAGVQAGRAGRLGVVIDFCRVGQTDALRLNGARVVVGGVATAGLSVRYAGGAAAFGNRDRLTVLACCSAPGARFAREGMPSPATKDQR